MMKALILALSFAFTSPALAGVVSLPDLDEGAFGQEFTGALKGSVLAGLFSSQTFQSSSLAYEIGKLLGENSPRKVFLSCDEDAPGHGADVTLVCYLQIGHGQSPSIEATFAATMDASGSIVKILRRSGIDYNVSH